MKHTSSWFPTNSLKLTPWHQKQGVWKMTFPSLYGIFSLSNEVLKPKACQGLGVFKSKGSLLKISRSHFLKPPDHGEGLVLNSASSSFFPTCLCTKHRALWDPRVELPPLLGTAHSPRSRHREWEKTQQKRGPSWELQNQNDVGHQTNFKHTIQKQRTQDKRKKATTPFLEGTSKSVWMTGVAASSHASSESERLQAKFYLLTSGEQVWLKNWDPVRLSKSYCHHMFSVVIERFLVPRNTPQFVGNFLFSPTSFFFLNFCQNNMTQLGYIPW